MGKRVSVLSRVAAIGSFPRSCERPHTHAHTAALIRLSGLKTNKRLENEEVRREM